MTTAAWVSHSPIQSRQRSTTSWRAYASEADTSTDATTSATSDTRGSTQSGPHISHPSLTQDLISKLGYRDLKKELEAKGLSMEGTTSQLRTRLREVMYTNRNGEECIPSFDTEEDDCVPENEVSLANIRVVTLTKAIQSGH